MENESTSEKRAWHEDPQTLFRMNAFLEEFANHCNVGRSCVASGVSRTTVYRWREDEWFNERYEATKRVALTALEDEMHRRAYEGTVEPVFHNGQACGVIRKYSDTLAIFLAKSHDPKYREHQKLDLGGSVAIGTMSEDEIRAELATLGAVGVLPAPSDGFDDLV